MDKDNQNDYSINRNNSLLDEEKLHKDCEGRTMYHCSFDGKSGKLSLSEQIDKENEDNLSEKRPMNIYGNDGIKCLLECAKKVAADKFHSGNVDIPLYSMPFDVEKFREFTKSLSANKQKLTNRYRCIVKYNPHRSPEIKLSYGDEILVILNLFDGWACGYNLTTNESGIFPISNLQMKSA